MLFKTNYPVNQNDILANGRACGRRMSNADKIFARSVVKRQMLIVKDLMALDKTYPGAIDKDVLGGLYALYTLLEDNVNSATLR